MLKNSNWYVQGYCTVRDDFRIFSLASISSLEVSNLTFEAREIDFDTLGIYFRTDRERITLRLLVDESIRDYMLEYCGEENVIFFKNNKFLVNYPFVEDDYSYRMLLQFGDKCECLELENIRVELINRIKKSLALYKE